MKFIKDERIESYENKVKAEAYNIMMVLAISYLIGEFFSINLGVIKEFAVFILFMTGALYLAIKLTIKGLASYSPIKGMHPIWFSTIICGMTSIVYGILLTIRNTNRYLEGRFSGLSIMIFVYSAGFMFLLTQVICWVTYLISKKREQKDMEE